MANPTIRIHDQATNEIIDRPMTADELATYEEGIAVVEARLQRETTRAALIASRNAKLEALGLTSEELNA